MLSRRDFIKGSFASGVALVTIGGGVNSLLKDSVAFAQENPGEVVPNNGKILILVQLAGGNDGDRTLIPYGSSAYYSARSATAIAAEDVLSLNSDVGLHPNLTGIKGLWDEGKMAVVQGVGYPDQNFSHFKSMPSGSTPTRRSSNATAGSGKRSSSSKARSTTPSSASA